MHSLDEVAPDAVDLDVVEVQRAMEPMDAVITDDLAGQRRAALEDVIEANDGDELPEPAAEEDKGASGVIDLMAALSASVRRAMDSRGREGQGGQASAQLSQPGKCRQKVSS